MFFLALLSLVVVVAESVTPKGLRCAGIDNGCCTSKTPCLEGDGDCDNDGECAKGLVCGTDNCPWGDNDDCCIKKGLRCAGIDNGCCTSKTPCLEGDGDCDNDGECAKGLVCGTDNCPWGDNDDCCIKKGGKPEGCFYRGKVYKKGESFIKKCARCTCSGSAYSCKSFCAMRLYSVHCGGGRVVYEDKPIKGHPGCSCNEPRCAPPQCPHSHPYAYYNGEHCCKYNKEKVYSSQGTKCDGSEIELTSLCCKDDAHIRCAGHVCTDYGKKKG